MNNKKNRYIPFSGLCCFLVVGLTLIVSQQVMATQVRIQTPLGDIEIELFDAQKPQTVTNFLNYVSDGDYQSSFIHRSVPGFVIQGGGFTYKASNIAALPLDPPVQNEPGLSNLRGTIAMAKVAGDPNSATSQWFINLGNNSAELDGQNGGFTVFGQVVGNGMEVVDAIAALPVYNAGSPFDTLPLHDFPGGIPVTDQYLVMNNMEIINSFRVNAGLNDAWVSVAAPFQGMFITVFPDLGLIFIAWFTFDSVVPSGDAAAVFGAADQRWITALGVFDGNRAELKAELTSGGGFNASTPTPVQDTDYGTINLIFKDCAEALVEFDFPAASESGQFPIHRVVEDNVTLCETLNTPDP